MFIVEAVLKNWTDLTRVEFNFANGTNAAYGALDDIVVQ